MDFALSEEALMLVSLANKFNADICLPLEAEMLRTNPDWAYLPEEQFASVQQKAKEVGLWGLNVPQEYGGAGLDNVTSVPVSIELAKTTIGTAHINPFRVGPVGLGLNEILFSAADDIKQKYLIPTINGDKISALAQTEADAGSDAASIKTLATRKGDDWVINGVKRFTTLGDRANFFYVTATLPGMGRKGITMFIVDADTPGVSILRRWEVMRPQYSTEVAFDDVTISDKQRISEVGDGLRTSLRVIGNARRGMVATIMGMCERAQQMTIDYVKQRETFGAPIATRQAVQWMVVDNELEMHTLRLYLMELAWKLDHKMDVRTDVSAIKLLATETGFRVLDRAIQCHGGVGLSKDLVLERWFRELRVWRIADGPSEIQKMIVARNLLGRESAG